VKREDQQALALRTNSVHAHSLACSACSREETGFCCFWRYGFMSRSLSFHIPVSLPREDGTPVPILDIQTALYQEVLTPLQPVELNDEPLLYK
jgi:hypothetical protein